MWGRAEITLFDNNEEYTLFIDNDWIRTVILELIEKIQKALNGDLTIPRSITEDIGNSWNKYLNKQSNMTINTAASDREKCVDWPGLDNLLLSTTWGTETWLFNKGKKIFLEITSSCPWIFFDRTAESTCVSFEECNKAYEPNCIIELDRNQLLLWLTSLEKIFAKIEKRCRLCREFIKKNPPDPNAEIWTGGLMMSWNQLTDLQRITMILNGLADNRGNIKD